MSRYRLAEQARQVLDALWLHIAEDNPTTADHFLDTLYEKLILVAGQPLLGWLRPELAPNLRSFPVGNYVIFYRPTQDGIEVARGLYGARDIDALLRANPWKTAEGNFSFIRKRPRSLAMHSPLSVKLLTHRYVTSMRRRRDTIDKPNNRDKIANCR